MIASVQYNDLRGTAAADVSDFYMNSLQKYLSDTFEQYDSERYFCNGCTMFIGESDCAHVNFICYDKSTHQYIRMSPEREYSIRDAFLLFKRFEVVIGVDINEIEVCDDIILRNDE